MLIIKRPLLGISLIKGANYLHFTASAYVGLSRMLMSKCEPALGLRGKKHLKARLFLSIALRIPTAHSFRVISARANDRVHVHNERNFPQAKLDREIN